MSEFDKLHVERISQWLLLLRVLKTNELYKVKRKNKFYEKKYRICIQGN